MNDRSVEIRSWRQQALARDLRLVELAAPTYGPSEKLVIRSEDAKSRAPTTIFGREYACGFIDEVHMLRKPKAKAYQASRFLSQLCKARMALTATPVVTAPQDLWNVGRILQVKGFGPEGDADLMNMERDLRNAKAITRKEKREAAAAAEANDGRAEEVLRRGIFSEEHTLNLGDVPALLIEQARDIRRRLEKCCIRRTLTSTDFEDKPILKLPKWEERFLRITLDASELAFLDDIYSHLPTSTSSTGSKPGEVSFSIDIPFCKTRRVRRISSIPLHLRTLCFLCATHIHAELFLSIFTSPFASRSPIAARSTLICPRHGRQLSQSGRRLLAVSLMLSHRLSHTTSPRTMPHCFMWLARATSFTRTLTSPPNDQLSSSRVTRLSSTRHLRLTLPSSIT
jgi:hypothetical protein